MSADSTDLLLDPQDHAPMPTDARTDLPPSRDESPADAAGESADPADSAEFARFVSAPGHDADATVGDYLAVDIGPRGLRARRTGTEPEMRLDIPQFDTCPRAEDLWGAVAPLTTGSAPALAVWTLGGDAAGLEPAALLAAAPGTTRTIVVDAAIATLVGSLGAVEPGVVLEMTTGVRTIVTDFDQVWHRIDGWGPILGDRGSASWLGGQGLAAGLRYLDGVPGGSEPLLQAARHAFGDERTWPELLRTLPQAEFLADFAPVVGDLARQDPVAEGLCRLAGEHLADAICVGAELLPGRPLTATGALLLVDAIKVSFASALGKRYKVLEPALGDTLAGTRTIAEHVLAGGRLPHHPPHIHLRGAEAIGR
ncbi:hypothetical protein [Mobilicoccus massiliensis]|uniref:hypothetical protein n=1 Tax=Mobilicoccus massiliensis TaxID=1522310 RepID=UPI0006947634|nr:hypothetical protein [Mobilicoccus massiliensis]